MSLETIGHSSPLSDVSAIALLPQVDVREEVGAFPTYLLPLSNRADSPMTPQPPHTHGDTSYCSVHGWQTGGLRPVSFFQVGA